MPRNSIAVYLPGLHAGGIERIWLNLAAAWQKRTDIDVTLVLDRMEGDLLGQLPKDIEIVELGARRTLTGLPRLTKYLIQRQPSVLLCGHNHNIITAIWARTMARAKTRVVISHHVPLSIHANNAQHWQYRIMPFLARAFFRFADVQIAVSEGVADDIADVARIRRSHIHVIHNPVTPSDVNERMLGPCTHPWLQDGAENTIVTIGRLTPAKDFPTLLRAFARLRRTQQTKLIILGEGEERLPLEALAIELGIDADVDLPGFQDNPFSYLARARLFVLSSAWEGFGNVLVEAMACGTPVVSTDCPAGPREILADGKFGHLTPVGDDRALAAAMVEMLLRPTPAAVLQTRAAEFAVEKIADRYLQVLLPER